MVADNNDQPIIHNYQTVSYTLTSRTLPIAAYMEQEHMTYDTHQVQSDFAGHALPRKMSIRQVFCFRSFYTVTEHQGQKSNKLRENRSTV